MADFDNRWQAFQTKLGARSNAANVSAPTWLDYGDPVGEWQAVRNAAAMFDRSDRTHLRLTGADRHTFLHNFCTNDIKALPPGRCCEAFVTNIKGRVLAHVLISAANDALWIEAEAGRHETLFAHLDRYIIREDVTVTDCSTDLAAVWIVGTAAADRLAQAFPDETSVSGQAAGTETPNANAGSANDFTEVGNDISLRRLPLFNVPGFSVVGPRPQLASIWENLLALGVAPAGRQAFDKLRIAHLLPEYGRDLSDDFIANEVGRTAECISFTKGCYLGQEPIARLDALGHPNRAFRGLHVRSTEAAGPSFAEAAGAAPEDPVVVLPADPNSTEAIGQVSTLVADPENQAVWALACVRTSASANGTAVRVCFAGDREFPATVFDREHIPPPLAVAD